MVVVASQRPSSAAGGRLDRRVDLRMCDDVAKRTTAMLRAPDCCSATLDRSRNALSLQLLERLNMRGLVPFAERPTPHNQLRD